MDRLIALVSFFLLFVSSPLQSRAQFLQVVQGTSAVLSHDVALDTNGNAYMTGSFVGNALFDEAGATLTSVGLKDIFVVKYDEQGALDWHFNIGGVLGGPGLDDEGMGIAVSAAGHLFVTGYFQGEADFDPGPDTFMLSSAGFRDAFIASYTLDGAFRWAKRFGSTADDMAFGINATDSQAIYFTGLFREEADFGPDDDTPAVSSLGQEDGFLTSVNSTGTINWVIPYGGPSVDSGREVDVDGEGNVYLLGHFSARVDFGLNSSAGEITSLNNSQDAVLTSYTREGSFRWAFPLGGPQQDGGLGLAVDASGNCFVTGHFVGKMDFDPSDTAEMSLTSSGARDWYIARYSSLGDFSWVRQTGSGFAQGDAIALTPSGHVVVSGFYSGTIFPDPTSVFSLTSQGDQDIMLASYEKDGSFRWASGIGGNLAEFSSGIAVNAANQVYLSGFFEGVTDFDPGADTETRTSAGEVDGFLVRYDTDGALAVSTESEHEIAQRSPFMELYPNPAQQRVHVVLALDNTPVHEVEMVDILGRQVRVIDRLEGLLGAETTISMDVADMPAGVYFVRIKNDQMVESRSFIVAH